MKKIITGCIFPSFFLPLLFADTACGPFGINWKAQDGFARIDGVKPESQKITFLKVKNDYNNVKIQWILPDARSGRWLEWILLPETASPSLMLKLFVKIWMIPGNFGPMIASV